MDWVRGFDAQILEAMNNPDIPIKTEAVEAAGTWQIEQAWPQVVKLVEDSASPKPLRIAAIGAVGQIRPKEAFDILDPLTASDDEEIVEAAEDTITMLAGETEGDDWDEDEDEDESEKDWLN